MTQREIERKKEEYVSVLADKTKDIQMQAQSIKNPEDESKNTQIFMKIKDAIDDMTRAYNELRNLDSEIVEEEQSYDAPNCQGTIYYLDEEETNALILILLKRLEVQK